MERTNRKRKTQEMTDSPGFVVAKISELNSVLVERDAALVDEIKEQHDEIGRLKKQLGDANEECVRWKDIAAFLHPDAVIDRVRMKLWHHGDLSILRKAIDPQTRVLRNTEGRGDRSLYISDSAPKKAGKTPANDCQPPEFSPKHECDEKEPAPTLTEPVPTPPADPLEETKEQHEEEEEDEEDFVDVPPPAPIEAQKENMNDAATLQFPVSNGAIVPYA
ncbi:hypothetical protein V7S43_005706 [Phytophthora oleae]|uniref:Uncharacterized protein n=1 Tax=Phytophthora oleae TaxID=2107226 RepID=A0ABD3FSS1_9STRA